MKRCFSEQSARWTLVVQNGTKKKFVFKSFVGDLKRSAVFKAFQVEDSSSPFFGVSQEHEAMRASYHLHSSDPQSLGCPWPDSICRIVRGAPDDHLVPGRHPAVGVLGPGPLFGQISTDHPGIPSARSSRSSPLGPCRQATSVQPPFLCTTSHPPFQCQRVEDLHKPRSLPASSFRRSLYPSISYLHPRLHRPLPLASSQGRKTWRQLQGWLDARRTQNAAIRILHVDPHD